MIKKLQSLDILQEKITNNLGSEGCSVQFFTGVSSFPQFSSRQNHLVVSADCLKHMLSGLFLQESSSVHLWFLCRALRDLFVDGLGVSPEFVSSIDRYELFPAKLAQYTLAQSKNFIFVGRDVPGKNIELLLEFFKYLNRSGYPNHKLYLCGQNLNRSFSNHRNVISLGDIGRSWTTASIEKPAFLSLSNYQFEDFSVACAEAQMAGMPIVIPDWMAFRDVVGAEVYKLQPQDYLSTDKEQIFSQWQNSMKMPYSRSEPSETRKSSISFCALSKLAEQLKKASRTLRRQIIDQSTFETKLSERAPWHLMQKYIAPDFLGKREARPKKNSILDIAYSRTPGLIGIPTNEALLIQSPRDQNTYQLKGLSKDLFNYCGSLRLRDLIRILEPQALKNPLRIRFYEAQMTALRDLGFIEMDF